MPLSFGYQLHAQGQGQPQDMTQSRNLFVGNVSLLLQILDCIQCRCIYRIHSYTIVVLPVYPFPVPVLSS